MDGIPAFSANTLSLKPAEFVVLSLPPALRTKVDNILLLMLLPSSMKADQSKKYYDFASRYELKHLSTHGVAGVKVKVFGTTLDTPGRAELLGMESSQSFTGCCVCTHCWSGGKIFDGYRRFLEPNSRGRQARVRHGGHVYEYCTEATRLKPKYRDNAFVRKACAFVKQRNHPFMGHKCAPLLSRWPDFDWRRLNIPDLMHGVFPPPPPPPIPLSMLITNPFFLSFSQC